MCLETLPSVEAAGGKQRALAGHVGMGTKSSSEEVQGWGSRWGWRPWVAPWDPLSVACSPHGPAQGLCLMGAVIGRADGAFLACRAKLRISSTNAALSFTQEQTRG